MENKQPQNCENNKKTPGKLMQNFLLEKAVHGKLGYAFSSDSPYRVLPHASTPPSRIKTIRNPFESQLTERLHQSVFSPSVFNNMQKMVTECEEENFKWTIEDIANLKPADIDEGTVAQYELIDNDPETERNAQANIEHFFNLKHVVPSPLEVAVKTKALISESTSPIKFPDTKEVSDGVAQTVLSLPWKLPEDIENLLKPFFSQTDDQQQSNRNSLYRRLFEFDEGNSPSSVFTSPAPSCDNLSPIDLSPLDKNKILRSRTFGSPNDGDNRRISDYCNFSPIGEDGNEERRGDSFTRLNFSDGRMSVDDNSLNYVPDCFLDDIPRDNNQSLAFESMEAPSIEGVLSNSSVNWDIEYRHVSLASPKSEDEMDVSKSNTPKSKIFMSQRKKLSDSFLKIEESDEEKENMYEKEAVTDFIRDDTTDVGYHTGSGLTMCETSWTAPHLFASTPTKGNHQ